MPNYYAQISAFDVLSVATQASVNNIANLNTPGYKSQNVIFETGPQDQGARISRIYRDMNPGPAVITNFSEVGYRSAQEQAAMMVHNVQAANAVVVGNEMVEQVRQGARTSLLEQELRGYEEAVSLQPKGYRGMSNVELPREFINLINTELAYSANAEVFRAQDALIGAVLNIVA